MNQTRANRLPSVALATSNDGKSFAWEYFTHTNITNKMPMALCAISLLLSVCSHQTLASIWWRSQSVRSYIPTWIHLKFSCFIKMSKDHMNNSFNRPLFINIWFKCTLENWFCSIVAQFMCRTRFGVAHHRATSGCWFVAYDKQMSSIPFGVHNWFCSHAFCRSRY